MKNQSTFDAVIRNFYLQKNRNLFDFSEYNNYFCKKLYLFFYLMYETIFLHHIAFLGCVKYLRAGFLAAAADTVATLKYFAFSDGKFHMAKCVGARH